MIRSHPPSDIPNLAIVHLGSHWFDYILDCLEQAILFNPEAQVWLIAAEQHRAQLPPALQETVRFVDVTTLRPTKKHQRFMKKTRIDQQFRGGFWRFDIERFFFIEELMIAFQLPHCFHIESDNLLYCSLKELLPVLQSHYPGIAATFDNDDRCIAGFMYFGSESAAASLTDYLAGRSALSESIGMHIIAEYRQLSSPGAVVTLPIVPDGFSCEWTTLSGMTSVDPDAFSRHATEFKSVFDAAAIGQFLGGVDPRNTKESTTVGFINESCVFDPSVFEYEWKELRGIGKVPFLRYRKVDYRINNLHIHSKALHLFRSRPDHVPAASTEVV